MAPPLTSEIAERRRIFRALVPYFGTVQPVVFFQRTGETIPGIVRIHNFIEGIYKPKGAAYTLSISSMLKSPYSDRVFYNPDRTWWMQYSSKKGAMDHAMNASLVRCMTDHQPVLVLRQVSDKSSAEGSRHRRWNSTTGKYCCQKIPAIGRIQMPWLGTSKKYLIDFRRSLPRGCSIAAGQNLNIESSLETTRRSRSRGNRGSDRNLQQTRFPVPE